MSGNGNGNRPQGPAAFSPEDMARRRRRSVALALVLGGLVIFFFVVTLVKTGPAILNRPL